ncbi:MAG: HNH endonuclease family protein, partial [Bacteroidia bacterium]
YILLIRRKITSLPVTKYDTFFPSLLDKIIYEPDKIRALHTHMQNEQLWVPDQLFEDSFAQKALYNQRELNFTRHILQEVDKQMQQYGEHPDYTTIDSVEHILPQTLDEQWKTYLGTDSKQYNLPTITDTIGNLCLNSRNANSSFGQKPFLEKQAAYTNVCALARDVKNRKEPWNISAIEQRSNDLAKEALKVWAWRL